MNGLVLRTSVILKRSPEVRILSPPLKTNMRDKNVLISKAVVYRKKGDKKEWFVVRESQNSEWEIAKTNVRKGESSVRAAIRMLAEEGAMRGKVLEEAGRAGGAASINGDVVPVRYLYYLMVQKGESGEALGFSEAEWLEYARAVRKLANKRDRQMLSSARKVMRELEKKRKKKAKSGGVA